MKIPVEYQSDGWENKKKFEIELDTMEDLVSFIHRIKKEVDFNGFGVRILIEDLADEKDEEDLDLIMVIGDDYIDG